MKKIEFNLPKGFVVPETKTEGDEVEVLATIELKANGRACLVAVDGHDMPGYEKDDKTYPQAAADQFDTMKASQSINQGQGGGY